MLEVRDLRTHFHTHDGLARAVDGVSFQLEAGRTLALVGESGSGKSVTALSMLGLLPPGERREVSGHVLYRGRDLLQLPDGERRLLLGEELAMVFQEPMTALNPVYRVGEQIMEAVMLHRGLERAAARQHAIAMLAKVGIPSPEVRVDQYPHELSGGMRQRVVLAMAMACEPSVLIADEPTTALDVTVQAQVLDLIRALQAESGMAVLLITHDLGVVAEMAHEVIVMYAGKVVESASVEQLFRRPRHPYTLGLLRSLPELVQPGERLLPIPGRVPPATQFPSGCRFRTRCAWASELCAAREPDLEPLDSLQLGHLVACHHREEVEA